MATNLSNCCRSALPASFGYRSCCFVGRSSRAALSFDAAVVSAASPAALDCMADVVPELAPALDASV